MKLNEKLAMDKHLSTALDLIDKAADEIDLAKNKEARFTTGQMVEFEVELITLRDKICRFKELAKEIYNEF